MVKSEMPFEIQEKNIKENLALLSRIKQLKERALKTIKQEGGNKNENTNS